MMLTKQQAEIVDHLRRTGQAGYVRVETSNARRIAQQTLPYASDIDPEMYGGNADQLTAYYTALNESQDSNGAGRE